MYNLHIVYINRLYKYIIIIHGHIISKIIIFGIYASVSEILLQFSIVNCYSRSSFLRPPRLYQPAQSWLTLTRYQGRRSPSPRRHAVLAILPQCALFQVHLYGTLRIFFDDLTTIKFPMLSFFKFYVLMPCTIFDPPGGKIIIVALQPSSNFCVFFSASTPSSPNCDVLRDVPLAPSRFKFYWAQNDTHHSQLLMSPKMKD